MDRLSAVIRTRALDLLSDGNGADADLEDGSIFFVGNATVIVRYAGFTILTDPSFLHEGDHAHVGYGLRTERQTDPAIDIDELPPIDFVLLSHMHGDHFGRVAEEGLDTDLPIVTTPHAAAELSEKGFRETYPLETWETLTVRKGDVRLDVTSTPARHGSRLVSKAMPPVMGSMLEFHVGETTALRLYVTGDTVMYDSLAEIAERYPDIDIALLHLGGAKVLGLQVTMDERQGTEAIELFDPTTAIPIHYDDYGVLRSSLEELQEAIREAGLDDRVEYVDRGDTARFEVPSGRL
ncbi:MBL fold metallo-hydrolase [Halalkalicoccus tibetensis]|uniref:MBL fold metallo-hydrolase n=1 Tax=Halalkalicoccus tibetensis TaxID=175632 RepID=A0ABD5V0V6_9EURY